MSESDSGGGYWREIREHMQRLIPNEFEIPTHETTAHLSLIYCLEFSSFRRILWCGRPSCTDDDHNCFMIGDHRMRQHGI